MPRKSFDKIAIVRKILRGAPARQYARSEAPVSLLGHWMRQATKNVTDRQLADRFMKRKFGQEPAADDLDALAADLLRQLDAGTLFKQTNGEHMKDASNGRRRGVKPEANIEPAPAPTRATLKPSVKAVSIATPDSPTNIMLSEVKALILSEVKTLILASEARICDRIAKRPVGRPRKVESEPAPEKRPIGRPRNPEVDRLATAIVGRLRGYKQYSVDLLRKVLKANRGYQWNAALKLAMAIEPAIKMSGSQRQRIVELPKA